MTPKLYKAAEVCEMTQVPAYMLRSWEKEFPGIGLQKSSDSPRLYRQSDIDQVLRIKQLVFAEGLTLAGARRRLEESAATSPVSDAEVAEVIEALGANARLRLVTVREGLESILELLSARPRPNGQQADSVRLAPKGARGRLAGADLKVHPSASKRSTPKVRSIAVRSKAVKVAKRSGKARAKSKTTAKRKRASA